MHDIVVVGGGPAGSASARLLARDHEVVVLEEHPVSGLPMECTGLISPQVIELSGIRPTVYNSFSKADFHFPDGSVFPLDCGKPVALLIDRTEYDTRMAESAVDAGAEYRYGERCTSYYTENGVGRVLTDSGDISAKVVIGADGQASRVRRSVCDFVPEMTVRGIQADIRKEMDVQDSVQIYMGSDIAPGFFAWCIPFGEFTRVGLCCESSYGTPSRYLDPLMKKLGFEDAQVVSKNAGLIPLGLMKRTYFDNTLLIGDSACQVKPISGGGLYPILVAAKHLAPAVNHAFEENDFTAKSFASYQTGWEKELRTEIKHGFTMRRLYNNLSDKDLNKIRRVIDKPFITDIAKNVDIDRPSQVCADILKHPLTLLRMIPFMIKGAFR